MMLHFLLKVNGSIIGEFSAQRIEATVPESGACHYDVMFKRHDKDAIELLWADEVAHQYGDGAWTLVRRAIAMMEYGRPCEEMANVAYGGVVLAAAETLGLDIDTTVRDEIIGQLSLVDAHNPVALVEATKALLIRYDNGDVPQVPVPIPIAWQGDEADL